LISNVYNSVKDSEPLDSSIATEALKSISNIMEVSFSNRI